ncbi:hypothetical protein ACFXPA_13930 [Amycolatopsis sp. NPDC059090]|uniref:hypothetical protein n=1 Tax=unclassified Amycolatopsis TaxID=2618356 RepID=UPI00366E7B40
MENVIDLDAAAQQIAQRRGEWHDLGITAGETTWREQGEGWPPALKTDRATIIDADSIGVELAKGAQEGSVVLFTGGWADFCYWAGNADDPILEAPGYHDPLDVGTFGQLLDRLTKLFA